MLIREELQSDQVVMHHTAAWWLAEFRGPVGRQMKEMVGADTVQTGFNGHIPAAVVCQAIALLNPNAKVTLAGQAAAELPSVSGPVLDFAADVVGKFHGRPKPRASETPAPKPQAAREEGRVRMAIGRAIKLKRRFGLLVACSYLREQGWDFDAAHRILLQADPRKLDAG
jgi:hypothetical protein